MAAIEEITENNMDDFKDAILVLDDMGGKLNKQITYYFTSGRHHKFQVVVICHKPAQIDKTCSPSADTIYITSYNNTAFFQIF